MRLRRGGGRPGFVNAMSENRVLSLKGRRPFEVNLLLLPEEAEFLNTLQPHSLEILISDAIMATQTADLLFIQKKKAQGDKS